MKKLILAVVPFLFLALNGHAATPQEVDSAIQKARIFLESVRNSAGTWEPGPTASEPDRDLPTAYTLQALFCSVKGYDPNIQEMVKNKPALDYLIANQAPGSLSPQALAARLQALSVLGSKTPEAEPGSVDLRDAVMSHGRYLVENLSSKKEDDVEALEGMALAMDNCILMGYRLPEGNTFWETIQQTLKQSQSPDGGWEVSGEGRGAAFLSTLRALNALLVAEDYGNSEAWLHCAGNPSRPELEKAWAWLGTHYPANLDEMTAESISPYTVLSEMERTERLAGRKYIGSHDWFKEGQDWLVKEQNNDGSFGGDSPNITPTALALRFVAKGRGAVLINKLQYNVTVDGKMSEGHWNQRPGDVATLIRWAAINELRPLNWQTVDLDHSSMEDMHQAPILYISGDQALSFSPAEKEKLKQYVQEGGMVFANPDGVEDAYNFNYPFAQSYFSLVAELFPQYVNSDKEVMRVLPSNYPYYTLEQFQHNDIVHKNLILTINNGIRNLMSFIRVDYAKRWQGRMYIKTDEWRNLSNLYNYETSGENIREKGATELPVLDAKIQPGKALRLARIQYSGNFDPEPAAWSHLASVLHNKGNLDLQFGFVKLTQGSLNGYQVAHLTGTQALSFTPEERKDITDFINGGGTLLIDSAGNSEAFTDSIQWELVTMFGDQAAQLRQPIAAGDALYQGLALPVESRRYARSVEKDFHTPQLRGIRVGDHWGVLFSREDLSSCLAGIYTDGLVTYTPESATALIGQILENLSK